MTDLIRSGEIRLRPRTQKARSKFGGLFSKCFHVWLTESQMRFIEDMSKRNGVTQSEQVRLIIEKFMYDRERLVG